MTLTLFTLGCLALLAYTFVVGFHDAPNATAIPIRTRSLTPTSALGTSALFNLLGLLLTAFLLSPLTNHWLRLPPSNTGLAMLLTALLTAIIWGVITWWFRIPSSSTHALMSGLAGSAWAASLSGLGNYNPIDEPLATFILIPLLLAPLLLFAFSWLAVIPFHHWLSRAYPATVNRFSRIILSLANSLISLVHGIQTGQRAMVVFAMLFYTAGLSSSTISYSLAALLLGAALALGTARGSSRIGYTFAHQMVHVDPFRGAIAHSSTALSLVLLQFFLNTPVSSSHLAASAVLGSGMTQRHESVRHKIVLRIILTWVLTLPASFALAATLFLALSPLL
ncbi:MAG: inorganic phosphate transporter [Rothia sp. (in: high G+C Gram-positive bacteria)]|nr:inorganic phosphate transporter [Rothia sp. (in: high G+C Gram-positive bacteria)]